MLHPLKFNMFIKYRHLTLKKAREVGLLISGNFILLSSSLDAVLACDGQTDGFAPNNNNNNNNNTIIYKGP